jgi:saccharopine dehydrogenase-like NADP-dependent oxidoreductase
MSHIHWIGTGLSAIPGLRRLIERGHNVTVWNRSIDKAQAAVGDLTDNIKAFSMAAITADLAKGDTLVSMLPGDWHVPLAELCLAKGANFVSSSYISPEMAALDGQAKAAGLCFVNEVGLDPGIDHVMAHWLVADYRASEGYDPENELSFISYCGGVPKYENPFRYKFSWSPLGVLKALRSPSKSIEGFAEKDVARPWNAISSYTAPLAKPEDFEVYPNRDSIPFMADYQFDPDWRVKQFVRGTLRLNGWAKAWDSVFKEVETLEGDAGEARLKEMSDQFWAENSYDEGEPDRVILCVSLKAEKGGKTAYHKTYALDAFGNEHGTAMAQLVSIPLSLAIEAVRAGEIPAGVTPAPSDPALVARWMETVDGIAQHLEVVDHQAA